MTQTNRAMPNRIGYTVIPAHPGYNIIEIHYNRHTSDVEEVIYFDKPAPVIAWRIETWEDPDKTYGTTSLHDETFPVIDGDFNSHTQSHLIVRPCGKVVRPYWDCFDNVEEAIRVLTAEAVKSFNEQHGIVEDLIG